MKKIKPTEDFAVECHSLEQNFKLLSIFAQSGIRPHVSFIEFWPFIRCYTRGCGWKISGNYESRISSNSHDRLLLVFRYITYPSLLLGFGYTFHLFGAF